MPPRSGAQSFSGLVAIDAEVPARAARCTAAATSTPVFSLWLSEYHYHHYYPLWLSLTPTTPTPTHTTSY